jgi:ribonuclease G
MKKIVITEDPWEIRIAVIRGDQLQNVYFGRMEAESLERTFFKGKITKVLPGIQTAFVDIGQERAGFLHISEIDRELAIKRMTSEDEELEEEETEPKAPSKHEIDIKKILHQNEPILAQVSKEPIHEKGAKLTTCFTLPGRFVVLMPNIPRIGVSKKIDDKDERQRLRSILSENLPEGMGAIIRTPSEQTDQKELLRDLHYLIETWNTIQERYKQADGVKKLYEDIDLSLQVVRDHLDRDVESVICDTRETQSRVYKFVKKIAPEHASKVVLAKSKSNVFAKYEVEKQIKEALQPKVMLKSGGSIIVESVEAMTVVDVNTGRYTGSKKLEETIINTNLEAAEEIVRQLRLRNIGGLIVIDFIDMASQQNRQTLYKTFERLLRERDKFQSVVLKVSEFGLVQMTRKRSGKTLLQQMASNCPSCKGRGYITSVQTECYRILRKLREDLDYKRIGKNISLAVHPDVFEYMTKKEYNALLALEKIHGCTIITSTYESDEVSSFSVESKQ